MEVDETPPLLPRYMISVDIWWHMYMIVYATIYMHTNYIYIFYIYTYTYIRLYIRLILAWMAGQDRTH
jgi:hypothetical protein